MVFILGSVEDTLLYWDIISSGIKFPVLLLFWNDIPKLCMISGKLHVIVKCFLILGCILPFEPLLGICCFRYNSPSRSYNISITIQHSPNTSYNIPITIQHSLNRSYHITIQHSTNNGKYHNIAITIHHSLNRSNHITIIQHSPNRSYNITMTIQHRLNNFSSIC